MTIRRAIGLTALLEYPPGVVYPSTVGIGRRVSRSTPMTERMVLIAAMPSQPLAKAARLGSSMWVTFGVIFAQTGILETSFTQELTSPTMSGSWPMAAPIFLSGRPWGHEKFSSKASTPTSWQRSTISHHASLLYSSMIEAIRMRSGNSSLHALNSSSQVSKERSEISSMFSQPMTSSPAVDFSLA